MKSSASTSIPDSENRDQLMSDTSKKLLEFSEKMSDIAKSLKPISIKKSTEYPKNTSDAELPSEIPNEISDKFFSSREEKVKFFRDFKIMLALVSGTASLAVIGIYIFTISYLF